MKANQTIYAVIIGILVLAGSSCLKEFPGSDNGRDSTSLTTYSGFEYKTVRECSISITLLNSQNQPVPGVYLELYTQNPITDESFSNALENDCIFKGSSDVNGNIRISANPPFYVDSLFVYIKHIGLPELTSVQLESQINLTIGGNYPSNTAGNVLKSASVAPVQVNGYYTLGTWNNLGVPAYLSASEIFTNDFLTAVTASLPENKPLTVTHPQYLASNTDCSLALKDSCEIWVSFVHEGAGWTNAMGYYTSRTDHPPSSVSVIKDKTVVFPNVSYVNSGGGLVSGNKVQLKYLDPKTKMYTTKFPAGYNVSWFLTAQGWKNGTISSGTYTHYSDVILNSEPDPSLKKHNVLLYDSQRKVFLLGFEDVRRDQGSDNDFNDAVFCVTVSPASAVNTSLYQTIDRPLDSDNDGVTDAFDEYPQDPGKAFNNFYPSKTSFGTLAFEDLWPYKGDYDFNDMVVDYQFNQITNAANNVTGINASFIVRAIGASYHNAFGLLLNTPPTNISSVSGQRITKGYLDIAANGTENRQSKASIVGFDDAFNVLPHPGSGSYVNTIAENPFQKPDTMYISIIFKNPVSPAVLGTPPFNPFLIINRKRGVEVHLPGQAPTDLADPKLLGTGNDNSNPAIGKYYVSDKYLPWGINIPVSFDYPAEKNDITKTYLMFNDWVSSQGSLYPDWYLIKTGYRNNDNIYKKK